MKCLFDKPYLIFWKSIPLIILINFFNGTKSLDINIHDTYYVIEPEVVSIPISIIFGIIGFGYWIMEKKDINLIKMLNLIHIILTLGGLLIIIILLQLYREPNTEKLLTDVNFNENLNITNFTTILIVLFGQIIYIINILSGIMKRKKTSG